MSDQLATDSRVSEVLAGTIAPAAVATVFVLARFYARAIIVRSWGWDDTWIAIAFFFGMLCTVMSCTLVLYGAGHHARFQTRPEGLLMIKLAYATKIFYLLVLGTSKIGLCCAYIRIFTDRTSKTIAYILMGFIAVYTSALVIFTGVFCAPSPALPAGKCTTNTPDLYVQAGCNILADLLLLGFVIPRIVPLNLPKKQKYALLGIVSISILVIVSAFIRMFMTQSFNNSTDRTWDFASLTTWGAVEAQTGLFCVSAPGIKPFIRKFFPAVFSTQTGSNSASGTGFSKHTVGGGGGTYDKDGGFRRNRDPNIDIELDSQNDGRFGAAKNTTTTKLWSDAHDKGQRDMDDGDSGRAIVTGEGGITKSVEIVVKDTSFYRADSIEGRGEVKPARF